jgi:Porin PorA
MSTRPRWPPSRWRERRRTIFVALGLALIGAGAAIRFIAAPALIQLPADLDTTVQLTGTTSALDQNAIQTGDYLRAVRIDTPVTIINQVRVTSTRGETAVVLNKSTVTDSGGGVISVTQQLGGESQDDGGGTCACRQHRFLSQGPGGGLSTHPRAA